MRRIGTAATVAVLLVLMSMPAPLSAQEILDCEYFNFQEQAQAILEEDESDPFFLDEDGDGFACADLPLAELDATIPVLPESGDYQCVDFPWQELAQEVYDEDPTDPYNLDPTGDGFPCSRLPFLADYALEEDLAADAALEDEFLEEDLGEATDITAEADGAAVEGGDLATDSGAAAEGPLTEEEREARRAERRAARQEERQAERQAERQGEETTPEEDQGQ